MFVGTLFVNTKVQYNALIFYLQYNLLEQYTVNINIAYNATLKHSLFFWAETETTGKCYHNASI